jgi:Tfp pilus assembly protein PilN
VEYTDASNPQRVLQPKRKTAQWLMLLAFAISLLVHGVFFFLSAQAKSNTRKLEEDIAVAQADLSSLSSTATELKTLTSQARSLHALFAGQKNFDAVVSTIQTRLYKNSSVTTLQISDKGDVTITGVVPSYEDYAKFYESLTDKDGALYFSTVKPTSVGKGEDGSDISFTFVAVLTPAVLKATQTLTLADLQGGGK